MCHLFRQGLGEIPSFTEFSYNNNYQASLQMSPFEVLYGQKCRTPLNWSESGERSLFGLDAINDSKKKVQIIHADRKSVV